MEKTVNLTIKRNKNRNSIGEEVFIRKKKKDGFFTGAILLTKPHIEFIY